jgi:hypothetical protein
MKTKTTCYIAGPMTGYPRFNFDAFDAARDVLLGDGFNVISPADLDREMGFDPDINEVTPMLIDEMQRRDVDAIFKCDMVFVLDGWEKSRGARAEISLANWRGIPVVSYQNRNFTESEIDLLPNSKPEPKAEDVLEEALRLTTGDRQNSYGPPTQDFARTAAMWAVILECTVTAKQVALCMIALKISRATWAKKRDNWTDIAGYARCGFLCEEDEK